MIKSKERGWIYVKSKELTNKKNIIEQPKKEQTNKNKNIYDNKKNDNDEKYDCDYDQDQKYEIDSDNEKNLQYSQEDNNDFLEDDGVKKRILCYNMIYHGVCKYGDKCMYAHSLEDQNVNKNRKEIYNILKSDIDLSNIDLRENNELYKAMLEMTKFCKNCNNNLCKGGYNCKSGVYDKKFCICINDLNYGLCNNPTCNFIHLSKRGLKPYYPDKNKKLNENIENQIFLQNNKSELNYKNLIKNNKSKIDSCDNESDSIESDMSNNDNQNEIESDISDTISETNYKLYNDYDHINGFPDKNIVLCNKSIFT